METTTIYNAECPICSREIAAYRDYAEARDLPLRFEPLQTADLARLGLTPEDAARRLYVLRDGELLSGLPAFIALWEEMPRFRWLARMVSLPVIRPIARVTYDRILAPALYSLHRRRVARQARRAREIDRDSAGARH